MNRQLNRRKFLKQSGSLLGASLASGALWARCKPAGPLNILVLGGTYFLGPAIVEALVRNGHQVMLFNRGITNPHLFPDLQKFRGDREKGPSAYGTLPRDLHWDLVIDVWPQKPQLVQDAVEALQGRCSHYLFISSIAVYRNYRQAGITEQHPLLEGSSYEPDNYSLNKVLCEKLVEKYFPGNFTIFRPGAIIGERDPGPFTHHLIRRFVTRGELLAPDAEDPVQVIDARDIGTFVNHCITKKRTGYYNLVGPARLLGYRSMLSQMAANLPGEVQIQWVDPSFLTQEMKVEPFVDIPFWIPIAKDPEPGFYQISHEKALAAGLRFSSFSDSVQRAYRSYQAGHTPSDGYLNGITAEREAELLSAWRKGR